MLVMAVCGALVILGLAAIWRWGGLNVEPPEAEVDPDRMVLPASLVAKRYLWGVTVAVFAGIVGFLAIGGAGGRLAMRLVAATAGAGAQGRITEAEQVVGKITLEGTIGFVVFNTFFLGAPTGILYMLLRRWLPGGRLGGLTYGALLLVIGSRVEPLRPANPDFDIVGPGWLSVLTFGSLVIAQGMVVAALAARYSRVLPLVSGRKVSPRYWPLLLLGPFFPVILPIALAGLLAVGVSRIPAVMRVMRAPRFSAAGRAVLAGVVAIGLPFFAADLLDIAGRGPS